MNYITFDKAFNIELNKAPYLSGIKDIGTLNSQYNSPIGNTDEEIYVGINDRDYLVALNSKGQVIGWNNYLITPEKPKVMYTNKNIKCIGEPIDIDNNYV
jgi:hypothetical protein